MSAAPALPAHRPWSLWLLCLILLLLSLNALLPGYAMIADPSGAALRMSTDWLLNPLFRSYLIPGLFLFLVIGAGSLSTAILLLTRPQWAWAEKLNPVSSMEWVWTLALTIGVAVMLWIVIQYFSVALTSWLQPTVFGVGALITLLLFEPALKRHFAHRPEGR